VPEIVQWQRDHATVTIVPISRGKAVGQQEQMQGLQTLLLQKEYEVAKAYQITITPSAVLVNANGTIASLVAAGPDEIRALLATATRTPQPAEETIPLVKANRAMQSPAPRRGDLAPAFQLPDLNGNVRDLESFQGEPVLILFWNPGCSYCRQMLDDMKALERNHSAKSPRLLLVSTGSSEANEAMELQSPILLDSGFSMARVFGARGTPSAVLVDAGGRIASEVAAGRDAILALLSQQGQTQEPISI
jgi:peroxiredoxin